VNYKALIDERGYKHKYIAKQIGVSETMMSLFLSGKKNLSMERKIKLNNLLKIKGENE
jgi:predicted transcriptional regulator